MDQRVLADAAKAVDLAGLDDEDVPCSSLELLTVDRPQATPFADELYLVVRMPVQTRPSEAMYADSGTTQLAFSEASMPGWPGLSR